MCEKKLDLILDIFFGYTSKPLRNIKSDVVFGDSAAGQNAAKSFVYFGIDQNNLVIPVFGPEKLNLNSALSFA